MLKNFFGLQKKSAISIAEIPFSDDEINQIRIQYQQDGVVILRNFFSSITVTQIEKAWKKIKKDIAKNDPSSLQRVDRFIFGSLNDFTKNLYTHPKIINLIKNLLNDSNIALYMNRLLLKDKNWNGDVPLHQDMPYFNGGHNKVSIFIPLQPVQAENGNGGLKFILHSHRYGNLQRGTIEKNSFAPMPELAPDLAVGDLILMNFFTWHYSEKAIQPDERPLLEIVYQPSSDGSYGGIKYGVAEPTLICGEWQTTYFAELYKGIIQDVYK
jgi:ectoine hydroxylase-related dioxygenase (phytanoyl-CoA dioxygenase family)